MDKPSVKQKAQAGIAALLRTGGLEVRIPQGPRVHAKLMIVDGARVFLGGQNVEDAPGEFRRELDIIFAAPEITEQVSSVFERDWASAPPARK
jgi:phosphatidylserine/phosphatidylglycerophosphate/cardiolipin synthase-like enzyme